MKTINDMTHKELTDEINKLRAERGRFLSILYEVNEVFTRQPPRSLTIAQASALNLVANECKQFPNERGAYILKYSTPQFRGM